MAGISAKYCDVPIVHVKDNIYKCQHCGKEYKRNPKRHGDEGKRFCSRDCSHAFARQRSAFIPLDKVVRHVLRCAECGKYFLPDNATKRYCSELCLSNHHRRIATERDMKTRPPRECECVVCGALFTPMYGDKSRVFCSDVCKSKMVKQYRKATKRARRNRVRLAFVEYVDARELYDRQKGRCALCGERIDISASVPNPNALTIDHIVPLAIGGSHSMANCQAAHFMCNSRKSSKPICNKYGQMVLAM